MAASSPVTIMTKYCCCCHGNNLIHTVTSLLFLGPTHLCQFQFMHAWAVHAWAAHVWGVHAWERGYTVTVIMTVYYH